MWYNGVWTLLIMKRHIVRALSAAVVFLSCAIPLHAWDGAFFDLFKIPYSVSAAQLGGIHAAYVDGVDTLFGNPAGFRSAEPRISFGQVTISGYDSILSVVDNVLTGDPAVGGPVIQRAGANLMGPLALAYVGNGLGFGIFSDTTERYWAWGPYPYARSEIYQNLVFISGYAFRIPLPQSWNSTLDLGFSVPVFVTARSDSALDVRGVIGSAITLRDLVITQPLTMAKGIGIEGGILYSIGDIFSAGIVFRNLAYVSTNTYSSLQAFLGGEISPSSDVPLPFDLTAGFLVNIPINRLTPALNRLTIMADYSNIFDFLTYPAGATNPLLHMGIGVELQMLDILMLRGGFYQMQPAGGISIDLTVFTLNLAVFGRELSQQVGGYPIWGYLIGLTF